MQRKKEADNHSVQYIMRALRFALPAAQCYITNAAYAGIKKEAANPNPNSHLVLLFCLQLIALTITSVKALIAMVGLYPGSREFTRGQFVILGSLWLTSWHLSVLATKPLVSAIENNDYSYDHYFFMGLMSGLSSAANLSVECGAALFRANNRKLTFGEAFDEIDFEGESDCTIR